MKSVRTYWDEDPYETPSVVRLHVVSRNAPPRPRWGHLYLALLVIGALGGAARFAVHEPWMVTVVDAVFGLGFVVVLAGWIRMNRIALARLDEPDAGSAQLQVRIVRPPSKSLHGFERRS